AEVQQACERAARGQILRQDAEVRVIDDGRMVIDFQVAPLRDRQGTIPYLVASADDVTRRAHVAQFLRESEERLRMAQDAAGLGIHDCDLRSGPVRYDQRARELWGIGPDEKITLDSFFAGTIPEDRPAVQAAFERATDARGTGILHIEHRIVRRSD